MGYLKVLLYSGVGLGVLASGPAFAQAAAPPPQEAPATTEQPSNGGDIEAIVVTAQKRQQRLQDVPVAVTALTSGELDRRGIQNVVDVQKAAPSLTVTENPNPQNNSINLRGIGTFAFGTGIEPAVSIVIDDVALLQQAQAFNGLGDLERIEVLRGPQGTLFGKNASAGVINIATKAPTQDLSATMTTSYTDDDQFRIEGAVSGGPADWVRARVSGFYDNKEGYIRNLTTGHKLGSSETYGGRFRVDLDPTSNLQISLNAAYSDDQSVTTRTWRSVSSTARIFPVGKINPGVLVAPLLAGVNVGPENFTARQDHEQALHSRQQVYSGKATLDVGFADLISVTSYQDWKFRQRNDDADFTDAPVVAFRPGGIVQNADTHSREFAQELRLQSQGDAPLDYMVGLYYANGKTDRTFERLALGPGASQWTGGNGTKSYAVFGQITYDLSLTTHIDAGARWNREVIDGRFLSTAPANAGCQAAVCLGKNSDNQLTYKVALRQDLNRDVMAYLSYATGYKGQGYDLGTGTSQSNLDNPVRPEHSKAYEVGLKGNFLDRKLQVNLAGFWTDYKDFQAQSANVLPDGTLLFKLNNVGKLRTRGVEAEVSTVPVRGLRISGTAAYTDAKIISFPNANCYTGQTAAQGCIGGVQDLSGGDLANSPKFKYTLSGAYQTTLPGMPFDGFINADWVHQSSVSYSLLGDPNLRQEAYGVLNGSVGVEGENGTYRLSLFVNNLFDKTYATGIFNAQGNSAGDAYQQFLPRDARRYFGVRLRLRTR